MHRLLSIFYLCLSLVGTAQACSCVGTSSCRPVKPNDVLFLGKVTAREVINHPALIETYLFHIVVLENFAGDQRVGQEMLIATGNGGGDCGYPFRIGETYLVDAYKYEGALSTGICAITAPAVMSTTVLRQLRTLAAHGRLPDLTGLVGIQAGNRYHDMDDFRPLPGISVTVTATNDGITATATTDADGVYTLPVLSPGKYTVAAALPSNLIAWKTEINKKPLQIEIPDVKGTGAACREDVMAQPSGSISGRVVNDNGNAVTGFVSAHSTNPQKDRSPGWAAGGNTDTDGSFTLHFLPGDTYQLQFTEWKNCTDWKNCNKVWFYPGTTESLDARPISLLDGEHVQTVRFVIPSATPAVP